MKIHEFQGKKLFKTYCIPVPDGEVAKTKEDVFDITKKLGGKSVVKAQIHAGGRGKGTLINDSDIHGVKVCQTPEDALNYAEALLGNVLKTHQTNAEGQAIKQVLVESLSDIDKEFYVALVLDRENSAISFITSTEGGMDIEEVSQNNPEKIFRLTIDYTSGFSAFHGRRLAESLGLSKSSSKTAIHIFSMLYKLFVERDASLVEINPFVFTKDNQLIALDAKINFDDNALFRQPDILSLRDPDEEDPKERKANDAHLSYVSLDGNIGCLVNGAGLAMATMDMIKYVGGHPANFLDIGGGATAAQVTQAFKIILLDPQVKAILINIFGGIAKCDVIAEGVVKAVNDVQLKIPLVVRLAGTNVEKGKEILANSQLKVIPADSMLSSAEKVVRVAQGGK